MKMADTINELYSKYTEGVEYALEDDRYFQYLFETAAFHLRQQMEQGQSFLFYPTSRSPPGIWKP